MLEGSVRKSGTRLRITAQLINVDDGFHIWSETYDREMSDVFEMQDDIAAKIMDALELHLGTAELNRERPTENMAAYEKYLAAKARSTQDDWDTDKPIALLKEAVSLDPTFALAWEFLAQEYWTRAGVDGSTQQEAAELSYEAAQKALALDPTLSIATAMAVSADPVEVTWHDEIEAMKKAWDQNPDDILLGNALVTDLIAVGYFSEALPYAKRMIEVEPLSGYSQATYSYALYAVGRVEEADLVNRKSIDLGVGNWSSELFISHVLSGKFDAAAEDLGGPFKSWGKDPAGARAWIEAARNPETGRDFLLEELGNNDGGFQSGRWGFFLAFGYLDDFFDELEENIRPGDTWYDAEPILGQAIFHRRADITSHPRYLPAMELMTITDTWEVLGPPDHCSKESGAWVCE